MYTISLNNNKNAHNIDFGTTERITNTRLYYSGHGIANCDYFIRPNETSPSKMASFLIEEARNSQKVEMKIWGCSDMSTFMARKIAMINSIGDEEFNKLFGTIELIDIDSDIISRAKNGLIGAVNADFKDMQDIVGVSLSDYLTPIQEDSTFFLQNEPKKIFTRSSNEKWLTWQNVIPCRISEGLMNNLNIRTGDIRNDLSDMQKSKSGVKRIFEFANGWYFLPRIDHVKIVAALSQKMRLSDIMLVGNVELDDEIPMLLKCVGFTQLEDIPEAFRKTKELNFFEKRYIKKLLKK